MSFTLIEPCCGSAALTLHLLGAGRSLLPYQGSKWRFRHGLQAQAEALGFDGAPERVVLTDPGPWGRTMGVVLQSSPRRALVARLEALAACDPREVYDALRGSRVPEDDVEFAAQFLFLQRLSFSGKAVGTHGDRWMSPGFNVSSAYGLPATERFGEVKPMLPSLIDTLRRYDRQLAHAQIEARQEPARPPSGRVERTLVYLDPPYEGSTTYPDGSMSRTQVIALATAWQAAGAAVMISEQHGVPLDAWKRDRLHPGRRDTSPFRGKQEEWLTYTASAESSALPSP